MFIEKINNEIPEKITSAHFYCKSVVVYRPEKKPFEYNIQPNQKIILFNSYVF